jgi:hypothetical protein
MSLVFAEQEPRLQEPELSFKTVPETNRVQELGQTTLNSYALEEQVELAEAPENIEVLLDNYEKPISDGWLVEFHDLPEGVTAYNASRVFRVNEVPHMLVREEGSQADQEFSSKLSIYQLSEDGRHCWPSSISNLPELIKDSIAQDPAISYVRGNWTLSWVEVELQDPSDPSQGCTWKSVIAIGPTLDKLERLTERVENKDGTQERRVVSLPDTKGLRFVELLDDRIGITTRTSANGKYEMGYAIADSWESVTSELLASARQIEGLDGLIINDDDRYKKRWIGPNDQKVLANGDVSLLFHAGRFIDNSVPDSRQYDVLHCVLTPGVGDTPTKARYIKLVAKAEDFNLPIEALPPKRPDLEFVAYPSCLIMSPEKDSASILLAALRDSGEAGIKISDPLRSWRLDHPEYANSPFPKPFDQLATIIAA